MNDPSPSATIGRFDQIFRLAGTAVIVVGIFLVLQPFLSALLVAGVLAIATWPLYQRPTRTLSTRYGPSKDDRSGRRKENENEKPKP